MAIGFFPRTRTRYDAARQANQSPWNWLLRGVATPNQTGDFLGAFQGGLSGALAAKQAAAQSEADQQRQRLQDDLTERTFGFDQRKQDEEERHNRATEGYKPDRGTQAMQNYGFLTGHGMQSDEAIKRLFPVDQPKPDKPDRPKLGDLNTFSDNFRQDRDVQNFTIVRDNWKRIEDSAKLGSGQGDLAVIFSFMRVLDPTSVVRETEFANAEQAIGRLQQMMNVPARWVHGNRLTPEGRIGFQRAAKQIYDTQHKTYQTKADMFKRQANSYGVDPSLVIPNWDAPPSAANDPGGLR